MASSFRGGAHARSLRHENDGDEKNDEKNDEEEGPKAERIRRDFYPSSQEGAMNESLRVMLLHGEDLSRAATVDNNIEADAFCRYCRSRFRFFRDVRCASRSISSSSSSSKKSELDYCRRPLLEFRPDVVVGKALGGAVALTLLKEGLWRGPTLLASPAVEPGLDDDIMRLPADAPVVLLAGGGWSGSCGGGRDCAVVEGMWAASEARCGDGLRAALVPGGGNDDNNDDSNDDDADIGDALRALLDDERPVQLEELGFLSRKKMRSKARAAANRTTLHDLVVECWEMRTQVAVGPYCHDARFSHGGAEGSDDDYQCNDDRRDDDDDGGWLAWLASRIGGVISASPKDGGGPRVRSRSRALDGPMAV